MRLRGFAVVACVAGGFVLLPGTPPAFAQEDEAQRVQVSLKEWTLGFKDITLKGGKARFEIVNDGTHEHAFEIEGKIDGEEVEIATPHLKPGERTTLIVALPRGEYQAYCPVDKHDEKGMIGTVTFSGEK